MSAWLTVTRGTAPLVVAVPHAGTTLPAGIEDRLVSRWQATKDADWWVDQLYTFAARDLGATIVSTAISRSVIDVNRDPSGASLYPGQATTELCPTTDFDGNPLYRPGEAPGAAEIADRRTRYFDPYHAALTAELDTLRQAHGRVILYDAHSIRSRVPRLFDGELPLFNIGTNAGATCAPDLAQCVETICRASGRSTVLNGRFRGGWTTRHYGRPDQGIHAIQMELATRAYLHEPADFTPETWPPPLDPDRAAAVTRTLSAVLTACIDWTRA